MTIGQMDGAAETGRGPAMADVAARAGVSHQTVSRGLNGHPNGAAATKNRVLATGRSNVVGVIAQNTTLFGPSSMVEALGRAAVAADLSLTVGHGGDDTASFQRSVERLIEQGAAGLVFIAPVDTAAAAIRLVPVGVPVVTVDGRPDWRTANVSVDQYAGGLLATRHLLEQGHPTVWHVAGPEDWHDSRGREAGWQAALAEAGIPAPQVLRTDWSAASGYAAGRVLAEIPGCGAVFAANDHTALGIMRAMAERGRSVPGDVSLVGFDDVPESGFFTPPLTTVRQEFGEVGRAALGLLVDQLTSGERSTDSVLVEPVLVPRQTVAPATGHSGRPPATRQETGHG